MDARQKLLVIIGDSGIEVYSNHEVAVMIKEEKGENDTITVAHSEKSAKEEFRNNVFRSLSKDGQGDVTMSKATIRFLQTL